MSDIKRILDKLDEMDDKQDQMRVVQEKSSVDLAEMRKDINYHIEQTNILRDEVKPIRNSHQQILGVIKFLGIISLLVSIAVGIAKLI